MRIDMNKDLATVKDYYFQMAEKIGMDQTITNLHNEIGALETKIYTGGYEATRLEKVELLRSLARDLWTMQFQIPKDKK